MAFNWRNSRWLYDALLLLLHAAYATISWKLYHLCTYPLNIGMVVDYAIISLFYVLVAVDFELGIVSQFLKFSYARVCASAAVFVFLSIILPLWLFVDHHWDSWTLWFTRSNDCSRKPDDVVIFVLLSGVTFCGSGLIHFLFHLKMRDREAAAYHPTLTAAQRQTLEECIKKVPKFRLTATDYSECIFCLEEFLVGDEV